VTPQKRRRSCVCSNRRYVKLDCAPATGRLPQTTLAPRMTINEVCFLRRRAERLLRDLRIDSGSARIVAIQTEAIKTYSKAWEVIYCARFPSSPTRPLRGSAFFSLRASLSGSNWRLSPGHAVALLALKGSFFQGEQTSSKPLTKLFRELLSYRLSVVRPVRDGNKNMAILFFLNPRYKASARIKLHSSS
jgi:hypothetical protein